ncbi:hypothetical protein AAEO56_16550 [Flavobacterium sp. DGU11]|uniref:Uncharacterized protein n=1 Tax=Flavobacterium arundinis TaxID=3139143 RepID=A0ABU9I0C8_9FLAO
MMKSLFKTKKAAVSMDELINYPKDSLGFHLGCFLFNNSCESDPIPEKEDVYRTLLTKEVSNKEEIAMHYYLFGNGDFSFRTLFVMGSGAVFYPHCVAYFYKRYRDGRNALRFYDLDHFRMLHLPLQRIKDAFLIR